MSARCPAVFIVLLAHGAACGDRGAVTIGSNVDPSVEGCGDLQREPLHCGFCGHSCKGRACVGGVCDPELLTDALHEPFQLVADGASLLCTDVRAGEGGVYRLFPETRAVVQLSSGVTFGVAVSEGHIFATRGEGSVVQLDPSGAVATLVSGRVQPHGIIAERDRIFWAEDDAVNGGVFTMALPSGLPEPLFSTPGNLLASDGGDL